MSCLSENDAEKIALHYLSVMEKKCGEPLALLNSETLDKPFGWVFFYNSKAYLETGDFGSMLTGNAPFIVNRNSGEVYVMGTAKSTEEYIADYLQELYDL